MITTNHLLNRRKDSVKQFSYRRPTRTERLDPRYLEVVEANRGMLLRRLQESYDDRNDIHSQSNSPLRMSALQACSHPRRRSLQ